jgi:hypothetical protein
MQAGNLPLDPAAPPSLPAAARSGPARLACTARPCSADRQPRAHRLLQAIICVRTVQKSRIDLPMVDQRVVPTGALLKQTPKSATSNRTTTKT